MFVMWSLGLLLYEKVVYSKLHQLTAGPLNFICLQMNLATTSYSIYKICAEIVKMDFIRQYLQWLASLPWFSAFHIQSYELSLSLSHTHTPHAHIHHTHTHTHHTHTCTLHKHIHTHKHTVTRNHCKHATEHTQFLCAGFPSSTCTQQWTSKDGTAPTHYWRKQPQKPVKQEEVSNT